MIRTKAIVAASIILALPTHAETSQTKAQQVQVLYESGLKAAKQGRGAEAKKAFEEVLRRDPNHGHARFQIGRIPVMVAKAKSDQRSARFTKTIIPKVDFHQIPLSDAVGALTLMASDVTDKTFAPNFVINDPSGKLQQRTVTLSLNQVPLKNVLQYMMQQTGGSLKLSPHAVLIRPKSR